MDAKKILTTAVVALVVVLAYERYGKAGKPRLRVAA